MAIISKSVVHTFVVAQRVPLIRPRRSGAGGQRHDQHQHAAPEGGNLDSHDLGPFDSPVFRHLPRPDLGRRYVVIQ
jgi:hypothetical protein